MSKIIKTKQCSHCKQIKTIDEFYKAISNRNGYKNECKVCVINRVSKYQKTIKGKKVHNQACRKYNKSEIGRKKHEEANRKYYASPKGKAQKIRANKKDYRNNKVRYMAGSFVKRAIERGKLPPVSTLTCHYCNKQATIYHHYKGYAHENWLDVLPVCPKCHKKCE